MSNNNQKNNQGPQQPPKEGKKEQPEAKNGALKKVVDATKTGLNYVAAGVMYVSGAAVLFGIGMATFVYTSAFIGLGFWSTLGVLALTGLIAAILCGAIQISMPEFVKNAGNKVKSAVSRDEKKPQAA